MRVLPEEKFVGIEEFYTKERGIGGKLRFIPEDFDVTEVPLDMPEVDDGDFVIAKVTAKNWETNHLLNTISKELKISRKRIGFAGTKDKRAVTTQFISIYYLKKDLPTISLKDVTLSFLYRSDRKLKIGDLRGNKFLIRIRDVDIDKNTLEAKINNLLKELNGIFPNFYGIQRFGVIRPVTHIVGKYIVKGDFEKAVETYLTYSTELESDEERNAREKFAREKNIKDALNYFPIHLSFERSLLNGLIENNDYCNALQNLPNNLVTMFIYAYQSYIFNRILSERIRRDLPLDKAVIGDLILPRGENKSIPVTERNINKINRALERRKCDITGLLPGYDVDIARGEMGEIEEKIIEEEGLDYRDFIIPEIPSLSSSGGRRAIAADFDEFEWRVTDDDLNAGKSTVELKFFLRKGIYATSFLREIMKADSITCY